MAERRMFAKTIVLSDAFLDMSMSARCLYFTLSMLADDDGFVNSPRAVMRQCGASDDDMKLLIAKKFVLVFDSGVIVVKHWRVNNYLRNDRYTETKYVDEKALLTLDEKGIYHREEPGIPGGIPNTVYPGKDSIELVKGSVGEKSIVQDNNSILSSAKKEKEKEKERTDADAARIAHFCDLLRFAERYGYDPEGTYRLAENEGYTRDEIDAARAAEG